MSTSNREVEYEADKSQQEQIKTVFGFDENGKDILQCQQLPTASESNDCYDPDITIDTGFSDRTPLIGSSYSTEKESRKKDSTGVRWVDWEGIAAISEKKGI